MFFFIFSSLLIINVRQIQASSIKIANDIAFEGEEGRMRCAAIGCDPCNDFGPNDPRCLAEKGIIDDPKDIPDDIPISVDPMPPAISLERIKVQDADGETVTFNRFDKNIPPEYREAISWFWAQAHKEGEVTPLPADSSLLEGSIKYYKEYADKYIDQDITINAYFLRLEDSQNDPAELRLGGEDNEALVNKSWIIYDPTDNLLIKGKVPTKAQMISCDTTDSFSDKESPEICTADKPVPRDTLVQVTGTFKRDQNGYYLLPVSQARETVPKKISLSELNKNFSQYKGMEVIIEGEVFLPEATTAVVTPLDNIKDFYLKGDGARIPIDMNFDKDYKNNKYFVRIRGVVKEVSSTFYVEGKNINIISEIKDDQSSKKGTIGYYKANYSKYLGQKISITGHANLDKSTGSLDNNLTRTRMYFDWFFNDSTGEILVKGKKPYDKKPSRYQNIVLTGNLEQADDGTLYIEATSTKVNKKRKCNIGEEIFGWLWGVDC